MKNEEKTTQCQGCVDSTNGLNIQTSCSDSTTTEITKAASGLSLDAPRTFETSEVITKWTPEQVHSALDKSKTQSSARWRGQVSLMGGDFISSGINGSCVTLSFCFEGPENSPFGGKRYGLTTGHIAGRLGDPIYALTSSIAKNGNEYPTSKVGTVVSLGFATDSLVFEFFGHVAVELYAVKTSHGVQHRLDLSQCLSGAPKAGVPVCGFGAQRQGTVGKVSSVWKSYSHNTLLMNDIGIDSADLKQKGDTPITHDGDCGMIYLHEDGKAFAMHHAITLSEDGKFYTSWGVLLSSIMASHWEYFGVVKTSVQQSMSTLQVACSPQGDAAPPQRLNLSFAPGEEPKIRKEIPFGLGYAVLPLDIQE